MENSDRQPDFESVKTRLAEIAEAVDDESLSLDDALDLYEEAVALGLKASDLLETGVVVPEEADDPENAPGADDSVGASFRSPGSPEANEGGPTAEADRQPEPAAN